MLAGYSEWPGLAQVFQVERQLIIQKTGEVREEVVAGVTSLPLERAYASQLLTLVRGQWCNRESISLGPRRDFRRGSIASALW